VYVPFIYDRQTDRGTLGHTDRIQIYTGYNGTAKHTNRLLGGAENA